MKKYWDLSTEERAALSREDLRPYLDVELMERGVLRPEPPPDAIPRPNLATRTVFRVVYRGEYGSDTTIDVAFPTADEAHAFVESYPLVVRNDYNLGRAAAGPLLDAKVLSEELPTIAALEGARVALAEYRAANDVVEKAKREHADALRTIETESTELIEDWGRCRVHASELARVRSTFAEYQEISGDPTVARTFLAKAFSAALIDDPNGVEELNDDQ